MTQQQAAENQKRIAEHYNLGWWYGTDCEKCCGVYPKFRTTNGLDMNCYYECEVCGKRNKELFAMPCAAEEAWNRGEVIVADTQMSFL